MPQGPVLVTGATGRTGRVLVDALRRDGQRVRALVRATSRAPHGWDGGGSGAGVEVAVGDLGDWTSLAAAMQGVSTVVLLSPMDPKLDELESEALFAALSTGVGHVVKISTTVPAEDSPISWWRAHARAEGLLHHSGLRWTVVRPNGIALFLLDYATSVREEGVMRTCAPDGRMALIDPRDIGAVVAAVTADPSSYAGSLLSITGPQALSYDDVASTLSALLRRPVRHLAVSDDEVRSRLLADGLPQWQVDGVVANMRMTRGNAYGFDRITSTVRDVTGADPRAITDFLRDHLAAFAGD